MSELSNNQNNWKGRVYINGTLIGAAIGFIGAYLYARASEENAERNGGQPTKLQTGQLLSIALAILGLIRQIAEAGKGGRRDK